LTERPWYSASSPMRTRWTRLVQELIEANKIDLSAIEEDVAEGLVRPSVLDDLRFLRKNGFLAVALPGTTDSMFVFPECRLTDSEYRLLGSKELQSRIESYAKRRKAKKKKPKEPRKPKSRATLRELGMGAYKRTRKLIKRAPHVLYHALAVALRQVV